jgi:hypothetical protein
MKCGKEEIINRDDEKRRVRIYPQRKKNCAQGEGNYPQGVRIRKMKGFCVASVSDVSRLLNPGAVD